MKTMLKTILIFVLVALFSVPQSAKADTPLAKVTSATLSGAYWIVKGNVSSPCNTAYSKTSFNKLRSIFTITVYQRETLNCDRPMLFTLRVKDLPIARFVYVNSMRVR